MNDSCWYQWAILQKNITCTGQLIQCLDAVCVFSSIWKLYSWPQQPGFSIWQRSLVCIIKRDCVLVIHRIVLGLGILAKTYYYYILNHMILIVFSLFWMLKFPVDYRQIWNSLFNFAVCTIKTQYYMKYISFLAQAPYPPCHYLNCNIYNMSPKKEQCELIQSALPCSWQHPSIGLFT